MRVNDFWVKSTSWSRHDTKSLHKSWFSIKSKSWTRFLYMNRSWSIRKSMSWSESFKSRLCSFK